ncbi:interferon alpha/beta receptor 2-like [Polypterus senegalus]|uniref:interferon alpha/beta receptor 2-like n=1 Tax=Polypterus senegalus TaxID=55291 RepID=UPI001965E2D4|nr:interferon alpha/beta receptor 2-like [Polypterus senegalus]XP_039601897.1 interferon alpha/beta receptor 2-like [Polypterus senegalus]
MMILPLKTLLLIVIMKLSYVALAVLPAPVKVSIDSRNLEHILRWKPGRNTPERTQYRVQWSNFDKWWSVESCSRITEPTVCNLTETFSDIYMYYKARVQAYRKNNTRSSWTVTSSDFQPFAKTILGPPEVTLSSHEDHLIVDMRPPSAIENMYPVITYKITVNESSKDEVATHETTQNRYIMTNLTPGKTYCIMVRMSVNSNSNAVPSRWQCQSSSSPDVFNVTVLLSFLCVALLCTGFVLAALAYSGFLCKPRDPLPDVLVSFAARPTQVCLLLENEDLSPVCFLWGRDACGEKHMNDSHDEDTDGEDEGGYEVHAFRTCDSEGSHSNSFVTIGAVDYDKGAGVSPWPCLTSLSAGGSVEQVEDLAAEETEITQVEGESEEKEETQEDVPLFSVMLMDLSQPLIVTPVWDTRPQDNEQQPLLVQTLTERPYVGTYEQRKWTKDGKRWDSSSDEDEDEDLEPSGYMSR